MSDATISRGLYTNANALNATLPGNLLPPVREILSFHKSLPDYSIAPVISQPYIAESLGLRDVIIKDERLRFGLPSFKPLGIAWAIRNAIIAELSETLPGPLPNDISITELAKRAKAEQIKLITATDGKLGIIVAKLGKYFGVESINTRIFVAEGTDENLITKIKAEGAEILVAPGDFEVAIREAWLHSVSTDGVLVSIDAEENYEDVPKWIVEGYSTIFEELDSQISDSPIDLIIVPVGVGGLAQAAVTHYKRPKRSYKTRILTVEPEAAACLHTSLVSGKREAIEPEETVINSLKYGEVSKVAWDILLEGVDASTIVRDDEAIAAMKSFREREFEAGACSGTVLAALKALFDSDTFGALALGEESTVVLVCTE